MSVAVEIGETASHQDQSMASMLECNYDKKTQNSKANLNINNNENWSYMWKNINVYSSEHNQGLFNKCRKKGTQEKQLLKNVNGRILSGTLTGVIGASGAGKTTLLNTITFRNSNKLRLTGGRYLNGQLVTSDQLASVSAYVQQQDLFIGTLTVHEHLRFQALLKMNADVKYKARMTRVNQVMDEFGLRKCRDTMIGVPGRIKGLSGGEQKRLAFASEILTNPSLLFCDEPTSGLDSFMAQTIIKVLKKQANKGKAILCTIHQPSSALFGLFDQILVMAEGRVAYLGPTNEVLNFMATQGYPFPQNFNPAEFLTDTLAIQPENEAECRIVVKTVCDGFEASNIFLDLKTNIENTIHLAKKTSKSPKLFDQHPPVYKASWFAQFRAVFWRSWISFVKDPFVLNLRVLQTIAIALIIGCVYYQQPKTHEGVKNINGGLFLLLMAVTYQNVFGTVDAFCSELPVFQRENWNGMYRTDVYFLAKVFAELPFYLFFPTILVCISYYMVGLHDNWESFVLTIGIMILVTNVTTNFGYFLSCLASTVTMCLVLAPAFIFPLVLLGGFFLGPDSAPSYLKWVKYISWFNYGYESLVIVQWQDVGAIACVKKTCPPVNVTMTGLDVIDELGFDKDNLRDNIFILIGLVFAYQFIAFLALLTKTFRSN